jgi:hypothetical protein
MQPMRANGYMSQSAQIVLKRAPPKKLAYENDENGHVGNSEVPFDSTAYTVSDSLHPKLV